jgi:hypothetical protein
LSWQPAEVVDTRVETPRVPDCDNTLVTLVRSDTEIWIRLSGLRSLQITAD